MPQFIERSIDNTLAVTAIGDGPSDARRPPTERQIYACAVRLFYEHGYHGTSMRALAEAAGLEISSLYYYFHNKQDLLVRIMTQTMHDLIGEVEGALDGLVDPEDCLRAALTAHILFHSTRRMDVFIADSELRALELPHREALIRLRDAYEQIFADILRRGVAAGQFALPDLQLSVYSLMGMCSGVSLWFSPEGRLSLEDIAAAYAQIFIHGISRR